MDFKKTLSMMKKYYKRLLSTSIICALGFAIMITLANSYKSLTYTLNNYISEYNYPNIEFKTAPATIDKTTFLKEIDGIEDYSQQFMFDTIMKTSNNHYFSIRATTYDETDFQKNYVWEEKNIDNKNTVFLEYSFAKDNNIHAGDKISIKIQDEYRDFYVNKIVSLPETFALSVVGDSWTLSADFGYVYVSRALLSDESKTTKENAQEELQEKYEELEKTEEEAKKTHDELQSKLDESKKTLQQKKDELKASESTLNKKISDLTKTKEELLNASTEAATNRAKLVAAENEIGQLINELEKNKKSLQDIKEALNFLNSSIKEVKDNKAILNSKNTVALMRVLRYFPPNTTVEELKDIVNYLKVLKENNDLVDVPVDVEETPLSYVEELDDIADEIIENYDFLKDINISDFTSQDVIDMLPEEYDKYVELLETLNNYYGVVTHDNLQQSYNTVLNRLEKYVNYIKIYRDLNLSSYLSDLGITVPVGELISGFTSYDDLLATINALFEGKDELTVKDILNEYDEANKKLNDAENALQSEKDKLIDKLHEYNINENEIDSNINLIDSQIISCKKELVNIKDTINKIDNSSGEIDSNLKQISDGLDSIQKELNSGKNALNKASKEISSKEALLFSEWMESSRQINEAKEAVEKAISDVDNEYNYEDYFNRIAIKLSDNANEEEVIKSIENGLAENDINILKVIPYEKSLVKQRINDNIVPIKKMSFFLPVVFFIIILNVVFLFINLIIKQCARELGILKSLGYSASKIRRMFMGVSLIVSLAAIVIGTLLGLFLTHVVAVYYKDFFPLPYLVYTYNIKMYFISIITMIVVSQISTLIATRTVKKLNPNEVITSNLPEDEMEPNVFNNLKLAPMLKYSVLSLFRNLKRFVFGCICVSASVMMIFASLSLMSSERFFLVELFEKRINYDAEIYMYQNVDDEFINKLKSQDFIKNVEVVSYFNKNIEFNGEMISTAINLINRDTDMIKIYDKKGTPLKVKDGGIILDYVNAKRLGVKKGDQVSIDDVSFEVSDISFQNIRFNQYVPQEDINKFSTNDIKKVIVQLEEGSDQKLLELLVSNDDYLYTAFTDRSKDTIIDDCELVDFVASIIIAFSAVIGFIIIINTNLTSLLEQKRKLCILKSMGYKDNAISKNWFSQSIIQLIAACIIGLPLGVLITIKTLNYLNNISHHYVFVNNISNYIITVVLVLAYLVISHLTCMKQLRNWDLATEIKSKD